MSITWTEKDKIEFLSILNKHIVPAISGGGDINKAISEMTDELEISLNNIILMKIKDGTIEIEET